VPPILYGCRQAVLTFMRSDRLGRATSPPTTVGWRCRWRSFMAPPNKALHPTIGRGRPLAGERQGVGQTGLRAANPLALDPS